MPSRPSRPQFAAHVVTTVIVSHDGARWLPECLAGLSSQSRPPQRVVAVDTGSTDGSVAILSETLGDSAVVELPRDTAFAQAIQAGLDAFQGAPAPPGTRGASTEWIWILHDDCAPEPPALRELLAQAVETPSVAVFGPKVVSWTGRHLVEVGLSVDSSGQAQTGLEPRELDQGQHDDVGDVLAVGTAGMLVRRDVWDAHGGLDRTWPLFAEDVDFGWRLNAAGERVRVAPRAVVRHAAALTHGRRAADGVAGPAVAAARRHGLQVVLANTASWLVPVLWARYLVEGLLRALVLLLARDLTAARDEILGFAGALSRPDVIGRARRRRAGRTVSHAELGGLLAPPALRWRRAGDALARAVGGRRAAEGRRRRRAPVETGPVSEAAETLDLDDTGFLVRLLRRPGVLLALGLTAAALIADRSLLGGDLYGGRLLPPPAGAGDLWATYTAAWHPVGLGSTTVAPPFLAVIALLATILFGKVWLAVDVVLLGAAPLAGLAAYAAAGRWTRSTGLRLFVAVTYAVLPSLTGAVTGGRLDVVLALILLPLLARAVVAAAATPRHRWHRWVGAGVVLAVVMACAPYLWALTGAALVSGLVLVGGRRRDRAVAAAVILAVPLLLLVPWTGTLFAHPHLFLSGSGLPEFVAANRPLGAAPLVLMHPGGPDLPPLWVLAPFVLAAFVALARRRRSGSARVAVVIFLLGLTAALVATRITGPVGELLTRYWSGVPLAVAAVGALGGTLLAADGAREAMRAHSFGWRQPALAVLALAAVAGTATAAGAWLVRGAAQPLAAGGGQLLPVFAAAEIARPTTPRVLALRSDHGVVRYTLVRTAAGPRLGDADVADLRGATGGGRAAAGERLATAVRSAVAGRADAVPALAEFGVSLIVVPNAADSGLSRLSNVDGLTRVPTSSAVVWRVGVPAGELTVLPPAAAGAVTSGGSLPAGTTPRPLPATAGSARARVPAGPGGRLLVLAEPRSSHWSATLDRRPLAPTSAFGWAQAWRLPAGGGLLELHRSEGHRTAWLALELALLVLALALTLPGGRRSRNAATPSSPTAEPSS
ncbi:MAG TPA: glycosyltransferase [Mycobacteriales bacterium]|nr:glycosyltransferase [Mycobacteriales bacterium]